MKYKYMCPACGGEDIEPVEERRDRWLVCLDCLLNAPRKIWIAMAKRRATMELALGINLTQQDRLYQAMIEEFGRKMFRELKANDAQKGDFSAWVPDKAQSLGELGHHTHKLNQAIVSGTKEAVTEHCADLANIAMAIDRSLGAL